MFAHWANIIPQLALWARIYHPFHGFGECDIPAMKYPWTLLTSLKGRNKTLLTSLRGRNKTLPTSLKGRRWQVLKFKQYWKSNLYNTYY